MNRLRAPDVLFVLTAYWLLVAMPHSFGVESRPSFDLRMPSFDLDHDPARNPTDEDRAMADLIATTP